MLKKYTTGLLVKLSMRVVDLTNISLATAEDKRYNIDKWAKLFKAKTWEDIKMLAKQDISLSAACFTEMIIGESKAGDGSVRNRIAPCR